jgi:peptidyl-prolyl cis-trans isomerase SurA
MNMLYPFSKIKSLKLSMGLTALLVFSANTQALQSLDHIIAIINDNVVTHVELQQRVNDFKRQMSAKGVNIPSNEIMQKQVLERILMDRVQMQLAKAQGIQIDDLSLNRMLEDIARRNKLTLDDLRISLKKDGINFEQFREQTRQDITIRQLQKRMVFDRVRVSQQEIDQFLEQQSATGNNSSEKYHIGHILITTPEAASTEDINAARKKADSVLSKINSGNTFRNIALKFSEGQRALNGGDLGWRTAAELPTLFLDAVRNLEKGKTSSPLRSASGFHIIKLIDKQSQQHIVKQTHARHILIRSDAITSEEQVRKKMTELKQQLDNGKDFSELATTFSQDPGSKDKGGDLGWASEGSFDPRFEKVMNSLKINKTSEPFRSQFGWHIIQVLERRQQDDTMQLKNDRAKMAIQKRKADEELQLWLRRIRDEAYVEYRTNNS